MHLRRIGPMLALLVLACEQQQGTPPLDVRIVDATGDNPVAGHDGRIVVRVRHLGELLTCDGGECASDIVDGDYDLRLPLESFAGINEVQIVIEDDDGGGQWIGAIPPFPIYGDGADQTGRIFAIVEHPRSCASLTLDGFVTGEPPVLATPRYHAASVVRRNVVLLAGGEDAAGESNDVDHFDQLLFDDGPLRTWDPASIGAARGIALSEDRSLVIGDASSWLFVSSSSQSMPEPVAIHEGAGFDSAIVDLEAAGAAVVGGAGSSRVTWVASDGTVTGTTDLTVVRDAPAAAAIGSGVLVVGGESAEWIDRGGSGVALDVDDLPAGRGGVLFPSPDGTDALWIGFEVDGAPSGETRILRDCDATHCGSVDAGTWDRPRADFAWVVSEAGTLWLIGGEAEDDLGELRASDAVDLVRWEDGEVVIEEGPALTTPRAGAAAFEHASGVVTVAGGRSDAPIETFELCTPAALDPL